MAGTVFYAEQPSTRTYWATSGFVPSPALEDKATTPAGRAVLAQFKNDAVFDKTPGRSWSYVGDYAPGSCPTNLPSTVSSAWGLCSVGS
jgi:hypothetical protein